MENQFHSSALTCSDSAGQIRSGRPGTYGQTHCCRRNTAPISLKTILGQASSNQMGEVERLSSRLGALKMSVAGSERPGRADEGLRSCPVRGSDGTGQRNSKAEE
jgi:hypothetical protein